MPPFIHFHDSNLLSLECKRLTGHIMLNLPTNASHPIQDGDIADVQEPPNGPTPQPLFIELECLQFLVEPIASRPALGIVTGALLTAKALFASDDPVPHRVET
jgi:hypothetical protein